MELTLFFQIVTDLLLFIILREEKNAKLADNMKAIAKKI